MQAYGNVELIACRMLEDEIRAILEAHGLSYPVRYVPEKLHIQPEKLRAHLQELVEESTADTLLFSIAQCGGATVGLTSPRATLVIPRCGDCIDLLLSPKKGTAVRPADSAFYTKSWLRYGNDFDDSYEECVEKYGQDNADYIIKTMYQNYRSFDIIDTGTFPAEEIRPNVEAKAALVGCSVGVVPGECALLEQLLTGNFTEKDFLILPPGTSTREDMFLPDTNSLYTVR